MLPIDNEVLLATNQEGLLKGYILIKKVSSTFPFIIFFHLRKKIVKIDQSQKNSCLLF